MVKLTNRGAVRTLLLQRNKEDANVPQSSYSVHRWNIFSKHNFKEEIGLPFGNQIKPHHSVKGRKEAGPRRLDPAVTYIL